MQLSNKGSGRVTITILVSEPRFKNLGMKLRFESSHFENLGLEF